MFPTGAEHLAETRRPELPPEQPLARAAQGPPHPPARDGPRGGLHLPGVHLHQ